MKLKRCLSYITLVLCALMMLYFGVQNKVFGQLPSYQQLKSNYDGSFPEKNRFLELNAAFSKALGRRELNRVVNLGSVSYLQDSPADNLEQKADAVAALSKAEVPFAFVYLPTLLRSDAPALRPYQFAEAGESAAAFFRTLQDRGVAAYDLADYRTDLPLQQRYFKSDHHWLPQYAFLCAEPIAEIAARQLGITLESSVFDIANYDAEILPQILLGTAGKRVGRLFTGLDDVTLLLPKFATEFTLYSDLRREGQSGSFAELFVDRKSYLTPNFYEDNPYKVYMGDDARHMRVVNHRAANDKRVMLLIDSYSQVLIPFLANAFYELDVYDLRYFDGAILEEIKLRQPDMIIMQYTHYALDDPKCFEIR